MRAARSTGWVVGTVFAVLAIFAGTWFLAAGPRFDDASETLAVAQSARDRNELLTVEVARLAEQFTHLDEYRAELAELRTQVPAEARLTEFVRQVEALATANGVTVTSLAPSVPILVESEAPVPAPTETTETTEATDASADATVAEPAPEALPLAAFAYVPLTMEVVGPYANVAAFLDAIQTGNPRIFVPTTLDGEGQDLQPDVIPPTADGDLKLTVTGNLYVLPEAATEAPADGTTEPAPLPSSDRNPFASLPGVTG